MAWRRDGQFVGGVLERAARLPGLIAVSHCGGKLCDQPASVPANFNLSSYSTARTARVPIEDATSWASLVAGLV